MIDETLPSRREGLRRLQLATVRKLFQILSRPGDPRYFGLQSMMEDRDGNLWFGFSGGLFRFDGQSYRNVGRTALSSASAVEKGN